MTAGKETLLPFTDEERADAQIGGGDAHYIHPTDAEKMWCGAPRRGGGAIGGLEPRREKATCVVCLDLRAMYGTDGWLALRNGAPGV